MGATHFLTRTLPKVAVEMALSVRPTIDAGHEHRGHQPTNRGDRGLRAPAFNLRRASRPLRIARRTRQTWLKPKSQKCARNERVASRPTCRGPMRPPSALSHDQDPQETSAQRTKLPQDADLSSKSSRSSREPLSTKGGPTESQPTIPLHPSNAEAMTTHRPGSLREGRMPAPEIPLLAEGCCWLASPVFLNQTRNARDRKRYVGHYSNAQRQEQLPDGRR